MRRPIHSPAHSLLTGLALFVTLAYGVSAFSQERPFPVLPGLESSVDFWKQIFTRHGFADVVLFDPIDPSMIYRVLRVPENDQGRAAVDRERARVVADYDLIDDETRIRSQRGAKEHFAEGLRISGRYMAQMQKIFRDEGLPVELAYLPLVESSFNIRARSGVGAVGMWQFMPETGKKFMRVDAAVDERRDPMASTRAAARLLKENYRILGNWPLAITAYNHGTDGIFRGIKAVESDNLVDLIQRYQSPTFGFASKNFYAEFLAVVDIATNSDRYFPFLRTHRPVALREVEIAKRAPLFAVLKPAAISQNDFFEWNPALDPTAKFIPLGYRVKLPPDKVDDFLSAHRRALATPSAKKIALTSKLRNWRSALEAKKAGKVVAKPAIRPTVTAKVARKPNLTSPKPNPAIRS
ncbi:MAG TPA: lytic transglycosylase domain-containing protein [Candidatus Binatia bacterium]|jgi:membrane-bound lytic murein transglycosylase D|nr:lytic transglycosylase domain-containing protein [Candidatus Binatia bacterium]